MRHDVRRRRRNIKKNNDCAGGMSYVLGAKQLGKLPFCH